MAIDRTGRSGSAALAGHSPYRGDIDDLRAIAVVAVVLFHATIPGFSGGFVGVDVFFAISGFLIGGIVGRDVAVTRFSFATFYARRARRILPALLVLTLCQCAIALLLLPPDELMNFAKSAVTALAGMSNIRFWQGVGYFAPDAALDPFLMTWSLGVEEQFYVVLPPLMLLIHRLAPRAMRPVVAGLSLLSLVLSVVLTARYPTAAFYLLPTRAWEMGAGVVLALRMQRGPLPIGQRGAAWLSAAGLTAIVANILGFDEATPFPGVAAALPVAGALALLASEGSALNRHVLASPPLRGIGLVSYSWYLWHWPLMAFARVASPTTPPPATLAVMAALSLLLGILSWRFVEQPFRRPGSTTDRATLLRYALVLSIVTAVPVAIHVLHGLPQRLAPRAADVKRIVAAGRGGPCLADYGDSVPNRSAACWSAGSGPAVALLGDSHAAALGAALRESAARRGLRFIMLTKGSCPPLLGATRRMRDFPDHARECRDYDRQAMRYVLHDPSIRMVVLAGFWSAAMKQGGDAVGYTPTATLKGLASNRPGDVLETALADTARRLKAAGKAVIVLGDVPQFRFNPAREAYVDYLPARRIAERTLTPSFAPRAGRIALDAVMPSPEDAEARVRRAVAAVPGVRYRSLAAAFCTRASCSFASPGGDIYYVDSQHLSERGARYALARTGVTGMLPR